MSTLRASIIGSLNVLTDVFILGVKISCLSLFPKDELLLFYLQSLYVDNYCSITPQAPQKNTNSFYFIFHVFLPYAPPNTASLFSQSHTFWNTSDESPSSSWNVALMGTCYNQMQNRCACFLCVFPGSSVWLLNSHIYHIQMSNPHVQPSCAVCKHGHMQGFCRIFCTEKLCRRAYSFYVLLTDNYYLLQNHKSHI